MKNMTKHFWIMLCATLALGIFLSGCATLSHEPEVLGGNFPAITTVPLKDFTSLGLVFAEIHEVENQRGEVFTYYELLKQAKELGADSIINVTIDKKREGTKFLFLRLEDTKVTYYGSALAIKYTAGVILDSDGNVRLSDGRESSGGNSSAGDGSGSSSSGKKWWNPFTWFK